jgi:hypothetical protein
MMLVGFAGLGFAGHRRARAGQTTLAAYLPKRRHCERLDGRRTGDELSAVLSESGSRDRPTLIGWLCVLWRRIIGRTGKPSRLDPATRMARDADFSRPREVDQLKELRDRNA